VSRRLAWAVETLDVQPRDRVLELGCGHGVALSLICARLDGGVVVGIDRSATMTAQASRRNAACLAAGRARVITAALHEADLGEARFDRVLAVHFPPLLRGDPARELAVVRRHLAAGGALHVVAQPVAAQEARSAAAAIAARLARHGFTPDPPRVARLADRPIVYLVARGGT